MRVLVTGATGYVGSRLIPTLVERGHEVYAAARDPRDLAKFAWADDVTPRRFDIGDDALVTSATQGIDAVIYLVHSMTTRDFVARDGEAADRVARAAEGNDVARIVYLSGLVPDDDHDLSDHLRSRLEVEEIFLASDVPAVVLRAAMVIGAGSTSFEILRRLTERVPFTPIPAWMRSSMQPVAIEDVVELMAGALEGEALNDHYDVGGDEVLSYPELLSLFARVSGLYRLQVTVPFVPKLLVGTVVAALTGISRHTVTALVDSLSHDMVCEDDDARRLFAPEGHTFLPVLEALQRSLSPHADATSPEGDLQASAPSDPAWSGGVIEVQDGTPLQRPRTLLESLVLGVPTTIALRALPRRLVWA